MPRIGSKHARSVTVTVLALLAVSLIGLAAHMGSQSRLPLAAPQPTRTAMTFAPPTISSVPAGWKLVWADNFSGTRLDRTVWNVENNSTFGDGNKELACLMDRPENVRVSGGLLTITARKEVTPIECNRHDRRFPAGRSYTSGMLTTKSRLSFQYGLFEIRARAPTTQGTSKGLWPAYWMLPAAGGPGELDVLELIGTGAHDAPSANRVSQTIHCHCQGTHPEQANSYPLPAGTFADGFHTYAVAWAPGSIKWYVDGTLTYSRTIRTTSWIDTAFGSEFYLLLNMAVGGSWPGSPDAATTFPARYQVDYVRVYKRGLTDPGLVG